MRNRIEIFGQIRVHHIGITHPEQFHYFPDRILGAALRPVAVGIRIEVRFKDGFQQQLGGCLYHSVPNGRNPERPLAPTGLRDHHPSHRLWLIRLAAKVHPDAVQPFLQPQRLDSPEGLPIHAWRACPLGTSCRRASRNGSWALPSPFGTASSEASGSLLVFPGSSPITSPLLLQKHI